MKRKIIIPAVLAVALVLGMSIVPASAYFTATTTAGGGIAINVKPSTDMHEWVGDNSKGVEITNSEDATSPVFVRVKVYVPRVVETTTTGDGWSGPFGDWYYYGDDPQDLTMLYPGETTGRFTLNFNITVDSESDPPAVDGDNLNIVVTYQATTVRYHEDGTPYADWTNTITN